MSKIKLTDSQRKEIAIGVLKEVDEKKEEFFDKADKSYSDSCTHNQLGGVLEKLNTLPKFYDLKDIEIEEEEI